MSDSTDWRDHLGDELTAAPPGACVICDAEATSIVQACNGHRSGPICPDCQYWCDGNITA